SGTGAKHRAPGGRPRQEDQVAAGPQQPRRLRDPAVGVRPEAGAVLADGQVEARVGEGDALCIGPAPPLPRGGDAGSLPRRRLLPNRHRPPLARRLDAVSPARYRPPCRTPLRFQKPGRGGSAMAIATIATAPSVYEELGVTPLINACGHKTVLGGSTPSPAVKAAMARADAWYVDMPELLERAGRAVAGLLGAEAATITPGCAAAMALGAAACVAGDDPDLIARLPHTGGLKDQVVIQAGQRYHYEHVVTIVG